MWPSPSTSALSASSRCPLAEEVQNVLDSDEAIAVLVYGPEGRLQLLLVLRATPPTPHAAPTRAPPLRNFVFQAKNLSNRMSRAKKKKK